MRKPPIPDRLAAPQPNQGFKYTWVVIAILIVLIYFYLDYKAWNKTPDNEQ